MIDGRQPLILIVDDTPINIRVMADALRTDYRIKVATDGPKALEIAASDDPPDLILLDVMMPGMDGYEVCRRLQGQGGTRRIPIILVTARGEVEDEARGLALGAVDYITKPFHVTILRARVKNQLDHKRKTDLLERLAALDGLTHIPNRRRLDEVLTREWRRAVREGHPLSLLMIDIDHFKAYNDRYGHGAGDDCLRTLVNALQNSLKRAGDLLGRYGGEEFAAVLPDTDQEGAARVARKLCAAVADLSIPHAGSEAARHVSISVGYATALHAVGEDPLELVNSADRTLCRAKATGRAAVAGCLCGEEMGQPGP